MPITRQPSIAAARSVTWFKNQVLPAPVLPRMTMCPAWFFTPPNRSRNNGAQRRASRPQSKPSVLLARWNVTTPAQQPTACESMLRVRTGASSARVGEPLQNLSSSPCTACNAGETQGATETAGDVGDVHLQLLGGLAAHECADGDVVEVLLGEGMEHQVGVVEGCARRARL